ncbi:hypothetical protein [Noviherbaspirillum pedocola]|uniref:Lipoprotein n=1 Tax=Noviherbaspirillum pedocola TaxID=2801341 RepID=A0A934SZU8_9BURK|nr:hypothetical protein [Noviherbaspirillum pedocola]MBK4738787.1 hypothetical protein [Noviherbaspirillum pedocola]
MKLNRTSGPMLAMLAVSLCGCSSFLQQGTGAAAGVSGAAIAASVTSDAAVATGIGVGVQSLAQAGVQQAQRVVHTEEQNQIAAIAGKLAPGQVAAWQVSHTVPIEPSSRGQVAVSRVVGAQSLDCREIVFSVDPAPKSKQDKGFFVAMICRDGERWKWASAEPATERWGALQ